MAGLTTIFTPPSWCSNRFVVFVDDHAPGTSIIPPSSGWIDPSFTQCIPTQYTISYPTFTPGVCPIHMQIVKHTFGTHDGKTVWTAACCQSGFSPPSIDDEYLCTSAITAPMAFLLDPNISTTDVYTTLPPELWIEHDQLTVQWEPSDLALFPLGVASQYELMMGITAPPSTEDAATGTTEFIAASTTAPKLTPGAATSASWPASFNTTATTTSGAEPSTSKNEIGGTRTNDGASRNCSVSIFYLFMFVDIIISSIV
ncbi:hypothetical protein GGS24DRAFT_491989 [Hypoxylon argillaceum]|nr:hypothetical protein GGS24DRAFT_491989 [Hypoxylon argillaceum]